MNHHKILTPPALVCTLAIPLLFACRIAGAQQAETAVPPAEPDKSYAIPALEIVGFEFLLNNFNRRFSGSSDYDVTWSSIRDNLRGPWVVDNDPFKVNQFAHAYSGSLYHGAGRSAGLGYWEAAGLTFAGSALWEIAGEKVPPSRNDQVTSGIAGSFLGEPLFRMARLVMDRSSLPAAWRPWIAAVISPPVGLNHLMFGSRFESAFVDNDPAYYGRLHVGGTHAVKQEFTTTADFRPNTAQVDFALDYGLPGKPGYTYKRPFDNFNFQVLLSSSNGVENISTRGLLVGTDYAAGDNYRGVWGLFGGYDYLAPQIFHVSTTSLSLGTSGQWWASKDVALQGTVLAGAGYAAASTLGGVGIDQEYHYGMAGRGTLALRLIAGTRAAVDVSARMVSLGTFARRSAGRDDISRVDTGFTWRIKGPHAISVNYVWSHRSASFPSIDGRRQTLGRVGLYYTLLGAQGFGAVDWRP
jgi:hypothetical protein